jgi:hypothetical protein
VHHGYEPSVFPGMNVKSDPNKGLHKAKAAVPGATPKPDDLRSAEDHGGGRGPEADVQGGADQLAQHGLRELERPRQGPVVYPGREQGQL